MADHITLADVREAVVTLACDATEQRTSDEIAAEIIALDGDLWMVLFGRLEHPIGAVADALRDAWFHGNHLARAWHDGSYRYWTTAA